MVAQDVALFENTKTCALVGGFLKWVGAVLSINPLHTQ